MLDYSKRWIYDSQIKSLSVQTSYELDVFFLIGYGPSIATVVSEVQQVKKIFSLRSEKFGIA